MGVILLDETFDVHQPIAVHCEKLNLPNILLSIALIIGWLSRPYLASPNPRLTTIKWSFATRCGTFNENMRVNLVLWENVVTESQKKTHNAEGIFYQYKWLMLRTVHDVRHFVLKLSNFVKTVFADFVRISHCCLILCIVWWKSAIPKRDNRNF